MQRSNTPWFEFKIPNLAAMFAQEQKKKNNATQKNKSKSNTSNTTVSNATRAMAAMALTPATTTTTSSAVTSQGPSEEAILAQAARWEAENNAERVARKARGNKRLANLRRGNATTIQTLRNLQRNRNALRQFNAQSIEKQRAFWESTPYSSNNVNKNAGRIIQAQEYKNAMNAQRLHQGRQTLKQMANQMYPGQKNKPLVISKLQTFKGRRNRKNQMTRKNRK